MRYWAAAAGNSLNEYQSVGIAPYMLYIADAEANLSVSGNVAYVTCWVEGNVGTTKTSVVAELQVKNGGSWYTVKSWNDTKNRSYLSVGGTFSVTSGKTYRVKGTVTAWNGTPSETRTIYSSERTA